MFFFENALRFIKSLILDIFAQNAKSKEGRLQVELAQNEYLLPRLAGQWSHLERLGGGIGTRGPGETQIETDRRITRQRIQKLRKDLNKLKTNRKQQRKQRSNSGIPIISLIGYTNAGKSSLLNLITGANVIQIFDSWAGLLPKKELTNFCYNPNKKIIEHIRSQRDPKIGT